MISGWAAATRRDYELMLVRYAPDVEFRFTPDFEALGLGGAFRGHDGMLSLIHAFEEAWERVEFQPAMMLDMGDRFVGLGHLRVGTASGLAFEREFAQLLTLGHGAIASEHEFLSWDEGLRAAGLDPGAIALPSRATTRQRARSAE
jgi:ketosteroid isomerase-like protein